MGTKHDLPVTGVQEADALVIRPGWCPFAEYCHPVNRLPDDTTNPYQATNDHIEQEINLEMCFGVERTEYGNINMVMCFRPTDREEPDRISFAPLVANEFIAAMAKANSLAAKWETTETLEVMEE